MYRQRYRGFESHPLRSTKGSADGAFIPWSVSSLRLYEAQGPVSGPPGAARRKSQIPSGFAIRAVFCERGSAPFHTFPPVRRAANRVRCHLFFRVRQYARDGAKARERRPLVGIARERETRTDDAARCLRECRTLSQSPMVRPLTASSSESVRCCDGVGRMATSSRTWPGKESRAPCRPCRPSRRTSGRCRTRK